MGSCAAPSAKGDDKFITTDYLQQCPVRYDRTYFDKIVASLLPLLEKLTTGKTAELLAPDYLDM
ncbi:hypothetical protein NLX19_004646, partial [Escherichia coli]|nr:hypothetical protein [Escherichia coli]